VYCDRNSVCTLPWLMELQGHNRLSATVGEKRLCPVIVSGSGGRAQLCWNAQPGGSGAGEKSALVQVARRAACRVRHGVPAPA